MVAYNATTTIRKLLSRIRPETWERISEVFIFDDSSADDTAEVATQYRRDLQLDKVRVFRNQVNLGYGGNQKRGYRYAIENGFDIVVLLHGDGQYAPEVMDDLLELIIKGESDAVFGSRMLVRGQDPSPCPDTSQCDRRPSNPYRRIRPGTGTMGRKRR